MHFSSVSKASPTAVSFGREPTASELAQAKAGLKHFLGINPADLTADSLVVIDARPLIKARGPLQIFKRFWLRLSMFYQRLKDGLRLQRAMISNPKLKHMFELYYGFGADVLENALKNKLLRQKLNLVIRARKLNDNDPLVMVVTNIPKTPGK